MAPGSLTSATEWCIQIRSDAVYASCQAPRYSVDKRDTVVEQCQVALNASVTGRVNHGTSEWCSPVICVKKETIEGSPGGAYASTNANSTRARYQAAIRCGEQLNDMARVTAADGLFLVLRHLLRLLVGARSIR